MTRKYVHVDRTACPWLIRRFIDPEAEFIFASVQEIDEIVKRENAIPYDVSGVKLGHHEEKCSFDALVEENDVKDPVVLALAKIIRAADTDKPNSAPEAAGLDAVMTGISFLARDDHEAVEKAKTVYDALYANCKLKLISEKYKAKMEKLDRTERREFLKKKLLE